MPAVHLMIGIDGPVILGNVQGAMPKVLDNVIPEATGPSIPFIKK